jgi:hypothetical protein
VGSSVAPVFAHVHVVNPDIGKWKRTSLYIVKKNMLRILLEANTVSHEEEKSPGQLNENPEE